MNGRVSIAMAVFNGERFIGEQLESLARQTRLPDELIVSDDASTDETVEIVREFGSRAAFPVTLLQNRQNVGCTQNYQRAISRCTGDLILLCDCDDICYPHKVAVTEQIFASHPKVGVALCDADLIDEQARALGVRLWHWRGYHCSEEAAKQIEQVSFDRSIPSYGPCVAFRGRLKSLILPLPSGPHFRIAGQDTFITWCIIGAGAGRLALIDAPLLGYRQHATQMTKNFENLRLPRWSARAERPLTLLEPIIQRLRTEAADQLCVFPEVRKAAMQHWGSRCFLPPSKLQRIPVVAKEFLSGRYNEFSDGLTTALKDLIFVR